MNCSEWFELVGDQPERLTRATSDSLNIVRKNPRLEIRKNFYTNRVVEKWNSVPSDLKRAKTVNAFKSGISELIKNGSI